MNPLVSVLLPVHNGAEFLYVSIESVLNQSYTNFELIIIDDGSTDNSCQIIRSFKDDRIVFIQNQKNIRLINTLNKGIEIAKGKYLARIDADDYMHFQRLEKQVDFLEKNEEYVLVGSGVQLVKGNKSRKEDYIQYYSENNDIVFSMCFYCPFIHPSILLRIDILRRFDLKFDTDFLHAEDYELWTRLIKYGRVHNLKENLTFYRIHSNQISNIFLDFQKNQMDKIQQFFLNESIPSFTTKEKSIIFSNFQKIDLEDYFNTIKKFDENKFFVGDFKMRYINKLIKNYLIEKKHYKISDWKFILRSSYFSGLRFSFFQYLSFIYKTLKFKQL